MALDTDKDSSATVIDHLQRSGWIRPIREHTIPPHEHPRARLHMNAVLSACVSFERLSGRLEQRVISGKLENEVPKLTIAGRLLWLKEA